MSNLSFVLHCVDGAVIATDVWTWPGPEGPTDVISVGKSGCVLVHGQIDEGVRLWDTSGLSSLSTEQPFTAAVGRIVEVISKFSLERTSKQAEVPNFGYLLVGYFADQGDLMKLNVSTANPTQVTGFGHNVFNGANDVARALDHKLPPRSFTVEHALLVAGFWMLQSHSVYSQVVGTRFALGTLDRATGLTWIEETRLRRIHKVAARGGLKWSRASLSLFHRDWLEGKPL